MTKEINKKKQFQKDDFLNLNKMFLKDKIKTKNKILQHKNQLSFKMFALKAVCDVLYVNSVLKFQKYFINKRQILFTKIFI